MKDALEQQLRLAEAKKTGSYDKRTEHLSEDGSGLFINRLILEDSPYLLQHAHNPVDWWAWGDAAFAAAKQQNKPIFLSIGYSTCHWCHVMEVESFDNVEVAKLLNKYFISIKMDREQYPDIDEVYMTGVQLMSGQGGWPMSNFLLPDGKPFFGATYFPAAGFMNLLQQVSEAWAEKELELITSARSISASIDRVLSERKAAVNLDGNILQDTLQALYQREDRSLGGLAGAPKFPQEPLLLLLLDRARRDADQEAMGFVDRALEAMACGGIYDQVAGGFSRYSVDAQWLVPHFEKMLYNQSQLSLVYLEAYQLTHNTFFRRVCEQTLDYVLRDMQIEEGGFYSATDADSEGIEGQFFVWSLADLKEVLSKTEVDLVVELYGVSEFGNFEGSNILNLSIPLNETAAASGNKDFYGDLDSILEKLYLAREQRIHPLRDDKLITAWAAAMITSLGKASVVFDRPEYLQAAERAAQLIWRKNVDGDAQLQRIYLNGTVSIAGQLEDYAHLCEACVVLFDITSKAEYLSQAVRLMNSAIEGFWSEEHKSFYLSPRQQAGPQITRSSNAGDGATLSPVAIITGALTMLQQRAALIPASLSAQERESIAGVEGLEQFYSEKINSCFASLSANIDDSPIGHASMLRAIAEDRDGSAELLRYVDGGRAKVELKRLAEDEATKSLRVEVAIMLTQGWHITAPVAAASEQGAFSPMRFTLAQDEESWVLNSCDFPAANGTLEAADGSEIAIYEDRVSFVCELSSKQLSDDSLAASAALSLQLQLCNDEVCSLPQSLSFRV